MAHPALARGLPLLVGVIPHSPMSHAEFERLTDLFFESHLAGVRARLERQTGKALERQRLAWRDTLRREAVLDDKDFDPSDHA